MKEFLIENWIALLSLLLSIIALLKDLIKELFNYMVNKKEKSSAIITINYINDKLIISNKGMHIACNIRIYIDNIDIMEHPNFCVYAKSMDLSYLSSGSSISFKPLLTLSSKRAFTVSVMYDDSKSDCVVENIINI